MQAGLKGEKLPAYDEKVEPGYGPPLKKAEETEDGLPASVRHTLATHPFARHPAPVPRPDRGAGGPVPRPVRGAGDRDASVGRRPVDRRVRQPPARPQTYFPGWIDWTGVTTLGRAYLAGAGLAAVGGLWAGYRYRKAIRDGKGDEFQPRYVDRLRPDASCCLLGAATLGSPTYLRNSRRESPWLELVLFLVPVAACLYFVVAHFLRNASRDPAGRHLRRDGRPVGRGIRLCRHRRRYSWPDRAGRHRRGRRAGEREA